MSSADEFFDDLRRRTVVGRSAKQKAALGSVGSALILVSIKVVLTVMTHSLGVLSEALHSSLDLMAAIITYLSVRVSDRPADSSHLYGHGKVENFSAFVQTGLLLLTAVYVIYEAFRRLFFHSVEIAPSLLAIGALGVAVIVDLVRSRLLGRVAKPALAVPSVGVSANPFSIIARPENFHPASAVRIAWLLASLKNGV